MRCKLIAFLFLSGLLSAQVIVKRSAILTPVSATPGLVNAVSTNSTLSGAFTAPMGTTVNTCATKTVCINFADPTAVDGSSRGPLGIVSVQYSNSPANSISVTDDKSNTWTCLTASSASSSKIINLCYAPNMAVATSQVRILFTGASTDVSVRLSQWYNIATASPVDGTPSSNTGTGGASANDLTAGSITTTQPNDLIYTTCARTGTPVATSFTAGSAQSNTTHSLLTTDIKDGGADQFGVQTVAGAINPQMTTTPGSTFACQAVAFKSATAGVAPSGMYVRKIQHYSTPTSSSGNVSLQFPSVGNLLVSSIACGGTGPMLPVSMTDGTNSWSLTGTVQNAVQATGMLYAANAAANSSGLITEVTSGTGDCTFINYDIVGAAAAPFTGRQYNFGVQPGAGTQLGNFSPFNMLPGNTNGIVLFNGQFETNTAVSFNVPSGNQPDMVFYGGEPLDGPNPSDQNGPWGHLYNSSNLVVPWGEVFASPTTGTGNWNAEADSFMSATGSTAQYAQVVSRSHNAIAATATTLAVTVPAITQHNLLAIAVGNGNSRTITKVCTDGATCAAGNSFTQATSAAATNGTQRADIWYLLDAPSGGSTTITVTYSATATNREATVWEVKRPSGSWAFDLANHTNAGTGSSSTVSTPSITTTGTTGFVVGMVTVNQSVTVDPNSGNECVAGGDIFSTTTDATASAVSGSAAGHQCVWTDGVATDGFGSSIAAFK